MALDFLSDAPPGMDRVLQLLANAESLTDDVAKQVFALAPIEGISADLFVRALHYADFVEPRNSEWNFSPGVRKELQKLNVADPVVVRQANRMLADLGRTADRSLAGSVVPSYLFSNTGQAYHEAAAGNVDQALSLYSKAARGRLTGIQWLASNLAAEQEERRILPPNRLETTFLRAMVMFREGERQAAEPLFRRIARTDETRFEVAVALSILGNLVSQRNRREAESFFLRSIEIDEKLDNLEGVAQTLHSFANLLARDPQRAKEAEERYLRSIEIDEKLDNLPGVAQTLHSLANLLARDPQRAKQAEDRLQRSLRLGQQNNNLNHQAQVLRSLSFLVERRSPKEAEELLERSLELNKRANNRHGQQIVNASLRALRNRHKL